MENMVLAKLNFSMGKLLIVHNVFYWESSFDHDRSMNALPLHPSVL